MVPLVTLCCHNMLSFMESVCWIHVIAIYRFDHLADSSIEHCDLTKVEIPIYQVRAARISFGNWLMDTVDVLRDFEHSSPLPACLAVTSNELKIWWHVPMSWLSHGEPLHSLLVWQHIKVHKVLALQWLAWRLRPSSASKGENASSRWAPQMKTMLRLEAGCVLLHVPLSHLRQTASFVRTLSGGVSTLLVWSSGLVLYLYLPGMWV